MKCPIDGETLVIADRQGVEIDYCPKCRGVWLDRGELDKIIERSEAPRAAAPQEGSWDGTHKHRDDRGERRRPERRESFLSELFDFEL
ncbi:zf-TFIIB domain-containing protein [Hyphobacterium sp.]|jgi:hypothetical protein|uniref:TFIIB-type zinc ribbon-containing protein n=1 Tax=Hyphobacterium sp. TaxID=2004662 RepID=UPI003BACD3C3